MSYYIDNYVCIKGKTKEDTISFFTKLKNGY